MPSYYYQSKKVTEMRCFLCMEFLQKASVLGKYNHVWTRDQRGRSCRWYSSSLFSLGGWGFPPGRRLRGSKTMKYLTPEAKELFQSLDKFKGTDYASVMKFYL
jgi:hypothetical protein